MWFRTLHAFKCRAEGTKLMNFVFLHQRLDEERGPFIRRECVFRVIRKFWVANLKRKHRPCVQMSKSNSRHSSVWFSAVGWSMWFRTFCVFKCRFEGTKFMNCVSLHQRLAEERGQHIRGECVFGAKRKFWIANWKKKKKEPAMCSDEQIELKTLKCMV